MRNESAKACDSKLGSVRLPELDEFVIEEAHINGQKYILLIHSSWEFTVVAVATQRGVKLYLKRWQFSNIGSNGLKTVAEFFKMANNLCEKKD